MENLESRRSARIVAYTDLVLSSIAIIIFGVMVFLGNVGHVVIVDEKGRRESLKNLADSDLNVYLWMMWAGMIFMAIILCIDLWAAIMLLKATKLGADPKGALERAKIWRNVNIVFLIISAVVYIASLNFFPLLLTLLARGILLYIVSKFIADLRQVCGFRSTFPSAPPAAVVK